MNSKKIRKIKKDETSSIIFDRWTKKAEAPPNSNNTSPTDINPYDLYKILVQNKNYINPYDLYKKIIVIKYYKIKIKI